MKRLLFITERFPPDIGGVARSAERLATQLCRLGVEVDILTWSRYLQAGEVLPPTATSPPQPHTPPVHRIGLYRQWDITLPHTLNVMDWLHQIQPYDAIWGHYLFPAGFLAVWFSQLHKLSSIVSARGNDIDLTLFPPGDFARLQWTLRHATTVTAVSQDMAHKIMVLSQRHDVIVQPNGVDTDRFQPEPFQPIPSVANTDSGSPTLPPSRASLGIAEDEIVLGFSGELREKKGQQFLLQALTTVRSRYPACLLIIGEVRPSTQTLLHQYAIAHPTDAERIIITGHLTEAEHIAHHLRLCHVYLQPSLWEGMPNALLEAMACGCVCIASDAGGIPDVIEHGITGFLLPRAQLHRLGEAILEYLDLPLEVQQQIGKAAQQRIAMVYSLERERERLRWVMGDG